MALPFSARLADLLGRQHPRTTYYRRPEIVGHTPVISMGWGTRFGCVTLLVLFIVVVSVFAIIAAAITGYSLFEMVSG